MKLLVIPVLALFSMSICAAEGILIGNGQRIAFLGDSVTDGGFKDKRGGYIHLVMDGLKKEGISATAIPAGVSGDTSDGMLKRLEKSVIAKKPDWMTLSCGINDTWRCKLENYKKNVESIVDRAQKAGIKVIIFTATMITEYPEHRYNKNLKPYNEFLRRFAKERGLLLVELNERMHERVAELSRNVPKRNRLTYDGIHMNGLGNQMMAEGILLAFGVPAGHVDAYKKEWSKRPGTMKVPVLFSIDEFLSLQKAADAENKTIEELVHDRTEK